MSNTTGAPPPTDVETTQPPPSTNEVAPPTSETSAAPPPPTSNPPPEPSTSEAPPPPSTTSSPPPPETSTSEPPEETTTSAPPPSTTFSTATSSSSARGSTSEESSDETSAPPQTTITISNTSDGQTSVVVITTTREQTAPVSTDPAAETSSPATIKPQDDGGGGLNKGSTVAIGVVVPIAAIAILAIVGLFWWKKRKARLQAEEERRKEVEDYSYNPNADPTIPPVGMMSDAGGYEMREDGSSGYRGWGSTTLAGSTGRKASTTISGGHPYSDATSPTHGNGSEARSGEPLMDSPHSGDGEILGAMGPSAANNRNGDVRRGPSNASSSYSAAGRSEGSDGPIGVAYGSGAGHYEQYGQSPYSDNPYNGTRPQEAGGAPIIRDNPARRNTRIESPSHFPQGSVGISQNF